MSMSELPRDAVRIACARGWDGDATISHLLDFIRRTAPDHEARLAAHFQWLAAREVADEAGGGEPGAVPHPEDGPTRPMPPVPAGHYRVLCQQYVEQVGWCDVRIDAAKGIEAPLDAVDDARARGLWEACGDTWEAGDDADKADAYAVLDAEGGTVWERG